MLSMKLKLFLICALVITNIDLFGFQIAVDSLIAVTRQDKALLLRADSLKSNNMLREALDYWEYVLLDIKALPQSRIRALSESADLHRLLNHDSLAYERLKEARNLIHQYKGQFTELENQHLNFLGQYFYHQNQPDSAVIYYRKAEITAEKRKDYLLQFQSYKGLGEVYDHLLNNLYSARYYYKKSVQLIDDGKIDLPFGEADVLYELTHIERKLGEKEVALTHGLKTYELARQLSEDIYHDFIANASFLVGHIHMERQEFKEAIPFLQNAVAVRNRRLGANNDFNFNLYYPALAYAYEASEQLDSAIILQKILLSNIAKQAPSIDLRSTTHYYAVGNLHLKNRNTRAARPFVSGYHQFYKNNPNNKEELFNALLLKGDLFTTLNADDSATHYYSLALGVIDKQLTIENLLEEVSSARVSVRSMPLITRAMEKIANSLAAFNLRNGSQKRLEMALGFYEEALEYARFSAIADTPDPTSYHIYHFHRITEATLLVAHRLYETTGDEKYLAVAFECMENDKLIAIQEESEEALFIHQEGMPDSLQAEKELIKSEITRISGAMDVALNDSSRESLEVELIKNFEKMSRWRLQADAFLHHYHNHANLFNVAAWDDFKSKNNLHLIEYFQGKQFIFGVSNGDSLNFFLKKEIDKGLNENIYGFLSHFRKTPPEFSSEEFDHYILTARNVYDQLVAPLMPDLPTENQVIIVPDGIVTLIPFEALLTETPEEPSGYNELPYLIHSATISYITSAAMLLDLPVVIPKHDSKLIAFALNSRFADKDATVAYMQDEIENAKLYYTGMTFRGKEATKEAFLRMAPRFEILYLLIHGDGMPFPRLEFSKGVDNEGERDLYAHEVYNMKLPGQIVVLTSTETGMGLIEHGESVVSLVRAFLTAGAGAVIIGLWEAHDEHSKNIVGHFFKKLAIGETTMVALRDAKINFILGSDPLAAHPHNWAELISYGEPVDVSTHKDGRILSWLLIIASLFIIGTYISTEREKYINRIIEEEKRNQLKG